MNSVFTSTDFFPSPVSLPGGLTLLLREALRPVPFCLTLVNLADLDEKNDGRPAEEIAALCLSPDELELFGGYSYPKRKKEWLGGRLAVKQALLALAGSTTTKEQLQAISILPSDTGAPSIVSSSGFTNLAPAISISHSGNYAVGMAAAASSCGIDIQLISDKTERVADRFCTKDERRHLQNYLPKLDKMAQLSLLWAAKEALKKSMLTDQPSIFQGMTLQSIRPGNIYTLQLIFPRGSSQPATVFALPLEEYMMAYTVAEGNNA